MKFPQDCDCDRDRDCDRAGRRRRPPALRAAAAAAALPPLLLLLLLPRAAAAPLAADSSGEAEPEEAAGRRAALPDCVRLARLLHARAAQLQEEVGSGRHGGSHTAGPGAAASRPRCDESSRCLSPDVREVHRLQEQHGNARPEQPQPPQGDGGRRVPARRLR